MCVSRIRAAPEGKGGEGGERGKTGVRSPWWLNKVTNSKRHASADSCLVEVCFIGYLINYVVGTYIYIHRSIFWGGIRIFPPAGYERYM